MLRHADLSSHAHGGTREISGLVVIDEIDMNLHADLQHNLLPKIMKLFPKVQFIATTHSPLFLMGMQAAFSSNGFQILQLPDGREIDVEQFSEFEVAYKRMRATDRFREEMHVQVSKAQKPILVVEDKYDEIYKVAFLKLNGFEPDAEIYPTCLKRKLPLKSDEVRVPDQLLASCE